MINQVKDFTKKCFANDKLVDGNAIYISLVMYGYIEKNTYYLTIIERYLNALKEEFIENN